MSTRAEAAKAAWRAGLGSLTAGQIEAGMSHDTARAFDAGRASLEPLVAQLVAALAAEHKHWTFGGSTHCGYCDGSPTHKPERQTGGGTVVPACKVGTWEPILAAAAKEGFGAEAGQ